MVSCILLHRRRLIVSPQITHCSTQPHYTVVPPHQGLGLCALTSLYPAPASPHRLIYRPLPRAPTFFSSNPFYPMFSKCSGFLQCGTGRRAPPTQNCAAGAPAIPAGAGAGAGRGAKVRLGSPRNPLCEICPHWFWSPVSVH